jgi:hypothetical protein
MWSNSRTVFRLLISDLNHLIEAFGLDFVSDTSDPNAPKHQLAIGSTCGSCCMHPLRKLNVHWSFQDSSRAESTASPQPSGKTESVVGDEGWLLLRVPREPNRRGPAGHDVVRTCNVGFKSDPGRLVHKKFEDRAHSK